MKHDNINKYTKPALSALSTPALRLKMTIAERENELSPLTATDT